MEANKGIKRETEVKEVCRKIFGQDKEITRRREEKSTGNVEISFGCWVPDIFAHCPLSLRECYSEKKETSPTEKKSFYFVVTERGRCCEAMWRSYLRIFSFLIFLDFHSSF